MIFKWYILPLNGSRETTPKSGYLYMAAHIPAGLGQYQIFICNMYIVNPRCFDPFFVLFGMDQTWSFPTFFSILSHKPETVVGFHVDFQDLPHRQPKSWA